jgi:ElaA protein
LKQLELHDRGAADIDPLSLLELLRLRVDVFVVEQACAYHELDGRDGEASTRHIWLSEDARPVAYLRLLDEGDVRRIGRVVTAADRRGEGLAARLVSHALATSCGPWVLDAQSRLEGWYLDFGFEVCGAAFVEDGIEHVPMRREAPADRISP